MKTRRAKSPGSTLVVTLSTLTALSLLAAFTLIRVLPRIRMAYQNAAWQEARAAAEAGVDCAMSDLVRNGVGFSKGPWTGWQQEGSTTPPPSATSSGGGGLLGLVGGLLGTTTSTVGSVLGILGGPSSPAASTTTGSPATAAAPMYLDNLKISAVAGVPSEVDIRLWALQPAAAPHIRWFRIRSRATCELPPSAYEAPSNLDAPLRRFSLRGIRPSLRRDDPGAPTTIRVPNISRTVEVLVEPIFPFELALWTARRSSLAPTGAWNVDSFDSRDDTKSALGLYPGRGMPGVQANGSVACGEALPFSARYGPTIAANGSVIRGAVSTNGGDDPATPVHENVSGAVGLDAARVRSDFCREMPVLPRPDLGPMQDPPASGPFVPGSETSPAIYFVAGSLMQLRIAAAPAGTRGVIVIMINGDLDLLDPLILPPSVTAVLFVRGQITFRDNVNAGPWNSNRANQLLIFADAPGPLHQVVQAIGPISVCAALYGPLADVALDGSVSWIGSLATSTLQVRSGGDGGIHYDEALATYGPPVSFRIARYIEDVRE